MSVALKLFDNYYINTNFLPSSIQYEQFDIDFYNTPRNLNKFF